MKKDAKKSKHTSHVFSSYGLEDCRPTVGPSSWTAWEKLIRSRGSSKNGKAEEIEMSLSSLWSSSSSSSFERVDLPIGKSTPQANPTFSILLLLFLLPRLLLLLLLLE